MTTDPMQKFGKEGMDMAMASFGEASAAALEKLTSAKTIDKAMEVQNEYLRSSYQDFVTQSTKLTELYSELAKEAYKPFEGILKQAGSMK
jgi:hypothetical protein